jgi:secreted PhoX family phosphatase
MNKHSDIDHDLDFDEFDEVINPRPEGCDFDNVVEAAISRRGFMCGVMAFGSIAALGGAASVPALAAGSRFAFDAVAASTDDDIKLPAGYSARVMLRWGDPIFAGAPEFDHATRGTPDSQARAFGDNVDGMETFSHDGRTLLVINNEYTNRKILWGNNPDGKPAGDDDIAKGKMAHGVTVVEVAPGQDGWQVARDSAYNRRITPDTDMILTGPAAGHDLLKTAADPSGTKVKGTWNNCGSGKTPWGTYLACEENFNGYFSAEDEEHKVSEELKRYGVSAKDWGYGWARIDERFDVAKNPNEPNRAGYVVEIDPRDPASTPRKLTALGRFKHENAEVVVNNDGRVVVYMGDERRGEFIYRFVSNGVYAPVLTRAPCWKTVSCRLPGSMTRALANAGVDTGNHRHEPGGNLHPHAACRLEGRRDHHGQAGVGNGQPQRARAILRADQQQEPRCEAQCRRRPDPGRGPQPA